VSLEWGLLRKQSKIYGEVLREQTMEHLKKGEQGQNSNEDEEEKPENLHKRGPRASQPKLARKRKKNGREKPEKKKSKKRSRGTP